MEDSKAIRSLNIQRNKCQIHQHTYKWKSAESCNTLIHHDAEFNSNITKGNLEKIGNKTDFRTVARVTAEGPHEDIQNRENPTLYRLLLIWNLNNLYLI